MLGSVRFFYECFQALLDFAAKIVESAVRPNKRGLPMMDMITATAKSMPIHGMRSSLFAKSAIPTTVLHTNEGQACAERSEAQASTIFTLVNRCLLLSERNFSANLFRGRSGKFFECRLIQFLFACLPITDSLLIFVDRRILSLLAEKRFQAAISSIVTGDRGFIFLQGEPAI